MASYSYSLRLPSHLSEQAVVLGQLDVGSKLQVSKDGRLEHSLGSSKSWVSFGVQKLTRTINGSETNLENVLDRVQQVVLAFRQYFYPPTKKDRSMLIADKRRIFQAAEGLRKMQMGYAAEVTEETPRERLVQIDRIGNIANLFNGMLIQETVK